MKNPVKQKRIEEARKILTEAGFKWKSLNNDVHWKIGVINFYPSTDKWHEDGGDIHHGLDSLLERLKHHKMSTSEVLTLEQIFEIAKHSKDKSLLGICQAIHNAIYNKEK